MTKTYLTGLIPLHIVSSANKKEHWAVKYKRDKLQRDTAVLYLNGYKDKITLPCTITLIRVAPRQLDGDNLQYAFKGIRDSVCSLILPDKAPGQADADERLQVKYKQQSDGPKITGFKIAIECEDRSV